MAKRFANTRTDLSVSRRVDCGRRTYGVGLRACDHLAWCAVPGGAAYG